MADPESAKKAIQDPNPVIDGRKANVNLAYLGAKPRGVQAGECAILCLPARSPAILCLPTHSPAILCLPARSPAIVCLPAHSPYWVVGYRV